MFVGALLISMPRDRPSAGGQDSTSDGQFPSDLGGKEAPDRVDFDYPRAPRETVSNLQTSPVGYSNVYYMLNYGGVTGIETSPGYSVNTYTPFTSGSTLNQLPLSWSTTGSGLGNPGGFISISNSGTTRDIVFELDGSGYPESMLGGDDLFKVDYFYNTTAGGSTGGSVFATTLPFRTTFNADTVGSVTASFTPVGKFELGDKVIEYYDGTSITETSIGGRMMMDSPSFTWDILTAGGSRIQNSYNGLFASGFISQTANTGISYQI